ncbi:MAG: rhomboid family intramembrane serine protease [Actinomycetota bacterium]|nr:rhomboid family intramembrane serine protease [Actinomycetota bacterium]
MLPLKDNIPTDRFPIVTVLFIAINVAFFIWQLSLDDGPNSSESPQIQGLSAADEAVFELGAIPYRLIHPGSECGVVTAPAGTELAGVDPVVCGESPDRLEAEGTPGVRVVDLEAPPWWATILTSMFMHGGWLHIIGNMLFLWVFGNNVEDAMGRLRFVLFYVLAGVAAVYAQSAIDPSSTIPTIGASGAVAGVLGAYILLHPGARVVTLVIIIFFVTLIEIPAMILLAVWAALQFLPALGQVGVGDMPGDSVAYVAHVGGFIFGLAAIKLFAARRNERPRLGLR